MNAAIRMALCATRASMPGFNESSHERRTVTQRVGYAKPRQRQTWIFRDTNDHGVTVKVSKKWHD